MSEIPQTPKSAWPIYLFGFIALALFLIGALALLSSSGPPPDEGAARSEEPTKAYADLQTENKTQLESFAWADKAKGTVQIPIDLAIQLTLPRLQSQQPSPAGPINAPVAAPAAPPETEAAPGTELPETLPAPAEPTPSGEPVSP